MRTKDLEKMIKAEANKVIIPDVSLSIKEKLEKNRKPEIIESPSAQKYQLRFVFKLSLSFLLVLFISVGIIRLRSADPITDDTIVEAVVLSTVTSSQVAINSLAVEDNVILLASGNGTGGTTTDTTDLETEVDHLTTYLGVVENMMTNMQTIQVQKRRMRALSNQYQMSFSTSDLDDETTSYTLNYQEMNKNGNIYEINGEIVKNDTTYQVEISYDKDTNTITTKTYESSDHYVEVRYSKKGNTFEYNVDTYNNATITESVQFTFESRHQITLSFTNSEATGTYEFQVATGPLGRKYLQIDYDVDGNIGQMQVAVSVTNRSQYIIAVAPEGQDTITFTKTRRNVQN